MDELARFWRCTANHPKNGDWIESILGRQRVRAGFHYFRNSVISIRAPASGNNGLLTGCEGHTEKYRTAVFIQPEPARAVLKDQGPVFLSMARANPVNKPFII